MPKQTHENSLECLECSSHLSHLPSSPPPSTLPISIPLAQNEAGKDKKSEPVKSPVNNIMCGSPQTSSSPNQRDGNSPDCSINIMKNLIESDKNDKKKGQEKLKSPSSEDTQPNMVQCKIQEDIIMKMVETVINNKMDTIRMMVESCVNKKLKDYRRLANMNTSALGSSVPYTSSVQSGFVSSLATASSHPSTSGSVVLSNFGTENFRYMYMPYLSDLIKSMADIKAVYQVVLKDLYFNPEHKENNIIFIPPNAFKTMTVFVDGIWKNYDLDVSLQNIIRRVNDVLQYYLVGNVEEDRFKAEIGKKKFDQLHSFTNQIDNMEEYPDFLAKIMQISEHTIITHQHLVKECEGNGGM